MRIDPTTAASVLVAIIAAASAYMAQRSAAKATVINTKTTTEAEQARAQADALREAYERARKFDVETIQRQDEELVELRLHVARLEASNRALNLRVWYLERGYSPPELKDEPEESETQNAEGLPPSEQDL